MPTQGTPLVAPYIQGSVNLVEPMAFGDLNLPFAMVTRSLITANVPSRFPVPPAAGGFLLDHDEEAIKLGLSSPYTVIGAMYPESNYLEPTTGQIWPRG